MTSPKSKRKLELDSEIASAVKDQMGKSKMRRSNKDLKFRRLLAQALIAKNKAAAYNLGISRKLWKTVKNAKWNEPGWEEKRAKRKDCIPDNTVKAVKDFFDSGGISHDLPDARSSVMKGGDVNSRKVMEISLQSAYKLYTEQNGPTIAFSTFKKLKPKTVLPFTTHKFRECLCEYCVNTDLKCTAVNGKLAKFPLLKIEDHYDASRISLCAKQPGGEYKKACIDRICENCGPHLLREQLQPVLERDDIRTSSITWFQWENVPVNNGTSTRMKRVEKSGTFEDLVEAMVRDVTPLSRHLFNAKWQFQQYKNISTDVPANTIVFCMDFAENYTARPQDAPQGCHWNNSQSTIHPVVASYKCNDCEDDLIVTDSIIFISDDLKHDYHAVQHFLTKSVELLLSDGLTFNRIISFSDGSPTQYKNRINFVDCSYATEDLGVSAERHYFGSRHGKGPCDREIGVIKKSVNRAVASRQAHILTANDLHRVCCQRLTLPRDGAGHSHTRRRFIFVKSEDINRDRQQRTETTRLKDTQRMHCIKGVQPYVVTVRERSCFCMGCRHEQRCINEDVTGNWTVTELRPPRRRNAGSRHARNPDAVLHPDGIGVPMDEGETDQHGDMAEVMETAEEPQLTREMEQPAAQPTIVTEQSGQESLQLTVEPQPTVQAAEEPHLTRDTETEQPAKVQRESTPQPAAETDGPDCASNHGSPQDKSNRVRLGDFVLAKVLPASGVMSKARAFTGLVQGIQEHGAEVQFLNQNGGHYVLPAVKRKYIVLWEEIVDILPPPRIDGRGRHFF